MELVFVIWWSAKASLITPPFSQRPVQSEGADHAHTWLRTIPRKRVRAKTPREIVLGIVQG